MNRKSILVVEDDEFLMVALNALLGAEGYEVTMATNGRLAQQQLEERAFDVVLSDLQMPVMGGLDLARWTLKNRKVPFIMMTGFIESINTLTAVEMGAVNILYKPFGEDELLRALEGALGDGPTGDLGLDGSARFAGYTRITLNALMPGATAQFNLYRLKDGSLQKIVSHGEPFQLESLAAQNFDFVYTESVNLGKLVPMSLMMTRAMGKSQTVDPTRRSAFIKQSIDLIRQKFAVEGVDDELLETLRQLVGDSAS